MWWEIGRSYLTDLGGDGCILSMNLFLFREDKEDTAKEVYSRNGDNLGPLGWIGLRPSGLWKVSVWVLRELKVFQRIQWECCFMMIPDDSALCWDLGFCGVEVPSLVPGRIWAWLLRPQVSGLWWGQIFSKFAPERRTPCRSASCRGEFLDPVGSCLVREQNWGGVSRAHPATHVTGDVMAPWDPWSLGCQWTFGQQVTGQRGPGGKERGRLARWLDQFTCFTSCLRLQGPVSNTAHETPSPAWPWPLVTNPYLTLCVPNSTFRPVPVREATPAGWSFVQGRVLLHVLLLMSVKDHRAQCSFYKLLLGTLKQISKLSYFLILKDCLPFCFAFNFCLYMYLFLPCFSNLPLLLLVWRVMCPLSLLLNVIYKKVHTGFTFSFLFSLAIFFNLIPLL